MAEGAGGTELVVKALQAVALEWTRRGPATRLTPALVEHYKARDASALLEGITTQDLLFSAEAAPLVFRVAAEGDAVAQELILWAGRELASLVLGVARQLGLTGQVFEVVMLGSMFNGSRLLAETLEKEVRPVAPHARFVRLQAPPVVGAVMLAMQAAGINAPPLRPILFRTTRELLARTRASSSGSGQSPQAISEPLRG
jgi:N-acetylglucosamine kinase-like BadF-type ATPase